MNIVHMKYAVEIAKVGTISKAAENLRVAQPNLSRAIKELEAEIGITIFERTAKGMTLTPDGDTFIRYAGSILAQVRDLENIYKKDTVKTQKFSISVPRGSYIAEAFSNFTSNLPESDIDIYYNETNAHTVVNNILQNDYHLGIIRYAEHYDSHFKRMLKEKGMIFELIAEFKYVLLMHSDCPLNRLPVIKLSDLSPYIEILHADPFVPSLPLATVRREEILSDGNRKIYIFERGSQFSILEKNNHAFMWVSPVPESLKHKYHLVERVCEDNTRLYKDLLIYPKGYRLSELDKQFITELCRSKRQCMP